MIVTKKNLSRRTILRGTGAALALPLLDAMVPALSASSQTAAKAVPRLGYFYVPNGMSMPNWRPKPDGDKLELSPIMTPIAPHKEYVTAVSGLSNYQSTLGSGGGVHTRAMAAWMTGVLAKPTEGSDITLAQTADQYAARVLGQDTVLDSIELGLERRVSMTGNCEYNYSCLYEATLSWRSPTVPNPIEINPRVVFERLFGEESDPAARAKRMRRNKSILDAVQQQVSGLRGTLGNGDRAMVDEYLQAIRDTERRIQKAEKQNSSSQSAPMAQPLGVPDTYNEHAEIMFDLLFLAYQADITRVGTFMLAKEGGGPGGYPWIGVPEDHHECSHHQNNPEKLAKLAKINTYHLTLFTRLVEKMKATRDGDGNLLDHSYLLYGAGMSDGDLHSPLDVPLLLVGKGCGQLKGNRHVWYPLEKKMPMTNLHITMLHRLGVPIDKMSDSTGELTEL